MDKNEWLDEVPPEARARFLELPAEAQDWLLARDPGLFGALPTKVLEQLSQGRTDAADEWAARDVDPDDRRVSVTLVSMGLLGVMLVAVHLVFNVNFPRWTLGIALAVAIAIGSVAKSRARRDAARRLSSK